jgi:hypothetical protein
LNACTKSYSSTLWYIVASRLVVETAGHKPTNRLPIAV